MKISLNWLKDFVELQTDDIDHIVEKMTINSSEIETVEKIGENLENIVIGKVMEVTPHPDADKLQIAKTDIGKGEIVQIVCGGSNLKEGLIVPVAKPGARVRWLGEGEMITVKKTRIRGEESYGMLVGSSEIALDDLFPMSDKYELLDLSDQHVEVGAPLKNALGLDDIVLDIDNHVITHRPDLFSHIGISREFVANDLATPKEKKKIGSLLDIPNSDFPLNMQFKDKDICSRYCAVTIDNITVRPSPLYVQKRLRACGIRPINNLVDITNYIMLEYGTPCHAFDLDTITGQEITHRKSKKGEKMTTLDSVERELPNDAIIIEDDEKIFDLAGIMGGKNSEISPSTKRAWIHVAIYDKILVRRAAVAMGHRTDAATIFEKGVPNCCAKEAVLRALEILMESCPAAKISSEILDIKNYDDSDRVISLRKHMVERLAGVKFKDEEVKNILEKLEFEVLSHEGDTYEIKIPPHRFGDIHIEADLVEEIIRIHGYNKIDAVAPLAEAKPGLLPTDKKLERTVRSILTGLGLTEIYTYSFIGKDLIKKTGKELNKEHIKIKNYISEDISIMRQSLLPRLLETIAHNLKYRDEVNIFELSKTYFKKKNDSEERRELCGGLCGKNANFRNAQGIVQVLSEKLGLKIHFEPFETKHEVYMHPGKTAFVKHKDEQVGIVTELHPVIRENFVIPHPVALFIIDIEKIISLQVRDQVYKKLPKFPEIQLDLNIVIDNKKRASDFYECIKKHSGELIKNIKIIDEYVGNPLPKDKRSLTFGITYGAPDRTLKEEEAWKIQEDIVKTLEKAGGKLREG